MILKPLNPLDPDAGADLPEPSKDMLNLAVAFMWDEWDEAHVLDTIHNQRQKMATPQKDTRVCEDCGELLVREDHDISKVVVIRDDTGNTVLKLHSDCWQNPVGHGTRALKERVSSL